MSLAQPVPDSGCYLEYFSKLFTVSSALWIGHTVIGAIHMDFLVKKLSSHLVDVTPTVEHTFGSQR